MPFIAECPFCKKGKLQCPDNAVGKSGLCPNPECGASFTVVRPGKAPQTPLSGPRRRSPRLTANASPAPVKLTEAASSTPIVPAPLEATAEMARLERSAPVRPAPPDTYEFTPRADRETQLPGPGRLSINALAVVSLLLAGLGLCWASFSSFDIVSYVLAGCAVLAGIGGFLTAQSEQHGVALAAVGPLVGALTAVVLFLAPGIFDPMRARMAAPGGRTDKPERQVIALSKANRSPPNPLPQDLEWVDASKGAVQFGDLWLRLVGATLESVELDAGGKRKQRTSERYLVLRVEAANNGAARRIDYESWSDLPGLPSKHRPTLQAGGGRVTQRTFKDAVVGQLRTGFIMPGKHLDEVLVFEPPPERFEWLRLELPLSAFGMEGKVQWQIPQSMIRVK